MAFTLTAIFVLFGLKQFRFRPAGPWNLGLSLGLFAFSCRVMSMDMAPGLAVVFNGMEYLTPIFFMIFIRVNFDDDFVFRVVEKIALAVMVALAMLFSMHDVIGTPESIYQLQVTLQFAIDALAVIWAYWCVITTWSSDLDAKRRKARGFFVAGIGPIVAVMLMLYFYFFSTAQPLNFLLYVDLLVSSTIVVLGGIALIYFVDITPTIFGGFAATSPPLAQHLETGHPKAEATTPETQNQSERQQLYLLAQVMKDQARFKDIGLNLPSLAGYVQLPEHRLRALINQDLGYRNFNAYLNHYRIEHACKLLKDQNNTDSILEVSMESGYRTLSTFNKAFKDITSLTPSEFRNKHQ